MDNNNELELWQEFVKEEKNKESDTIMLLNRLYSDLTTDSSYDGTWLDKWIEKNVPDSLK